MGKDIFMNVNDEDNLFEMLLEKFNVEEISQMVRSVDTTDTLAIEDFLYSFFTTEIIEPIIDELENEEEEDEEEGE